MRQKAEGLARFFPSSSWLQKCSLILAHLRSVPCRTSHKHATLVILGDFQAGAHFLEAFPPWGVGGRPMHPYSFSGGPLKRSIGSPTLTLDASGPSVCAFNSILPHLTVYPFLGSSSIARRYSSRFPTLAPFGSVTRSPADNVVAKLIYALLQKQNTLSHSHLYRKPEDAHCSVTPVSLDEHEDNHAYRPAMLQAFVRYKSRRA